MNFRTFAALPILAGLAVLCLPADAQAAKKPKSDPKHPVVILKTTLGELRVELDADKAPISTKNFLRYVDEKFYDGTLFHRVISDYMIQGGGYDRKMTDKQTHDPIKNERQNGLKNLRGTIAMAHKAELDSATSQFFINVVDNPKLDYPTVDGYAVFGKVIAGMDVADKIRAVPVVDTVPETPVVIESVRRE